jgi:hypothetical protein
MGETLGKRGDTAKITGANYVFWNSFWVGDADFFYQNRHPDKITIGRPSTSVLDWSTRAISFLVSSFPARLTMFTSSLVILQIPITSTSWSYIIVNSI